MYGESESSEPRITYDLETKLADVSLPFEEIVPAAVKDWLNVLARSHGTTREVVLFSVLTSTSALIGKSSLQVSSTYKEGGGESFRCCGLPFRFWENACVPFRMYRSHRGTYRAQNKQKPSLSMTRRVMACSITSLRAIPTLSSASTRPTHF